MPACGNQDVVVSHLVYETMLFGDSAQLVVSKVIAQGLGFPDTLIAISHDVLDEKINPFEDLPVLTLPP